MSTPEPWTEEGREEARTQAVNAYLQQQIDDKKPIDDLHLVQIGGMTLAEAERLATHHRNYLESQAYDERMAPHFAWRDQQRMRNQPFWNRRNASDGLGRIIGHIFRPR